MAKITTQVLHEKSPTQHRLVILKGGVPSRSGWFENREVGKFQNLYFYVGAAGDMPAVFRVAAVAHEELA